MYSCNVIAVVPIDVAVVVVAAAVAPLSRPSPAATAAAAGRFPRFQRFTHGSEGSAAGREKEAEEDDEEDVEVCNHVLQLLLERQALLLGLADTAGTSLTPAARGKPTSIFMFVLVRATGVRRCT